MEKILLTSFIDLYTLSNDTTKWSLANFAKNPPRLYRLQKIDSLMAALKINSSYQEFQYGEFLFEEGRQDLAGFKNRIEENYPSIFETIFLNNREDSDFQFVFEVLLRYRIKVQQLINVKTCVLEVSGINTIPLTIISDIDKKSQKDIAAIDNILYYLLNPTGINYTKEDLIIKFNYPDVDLAQIDKDWI